MYQELFAKAGLSLDRLRTFCLVAQAGGVTKAAKGDPNRQSQYSRQVKELEEFFGVDLFSKVGGGVSLTTHGQRLAAMGHLTLQGLTDFAATCGNEPVQISLGSGDSLLQWAVLSKLEDLRKEFPAVCFVLRNLRTRQVVESLQTGLLDLGLIRTESVPKSLHHLKIGTLLYRLYVPKVLATLHRKKGTFKNLPLAVLEGDGSHALFMEAMSTSHPGEYDVRLLCSSFPLITRALKDASYAAVLPVLAMEDLNSKDFLEVDLPELKALEKPMSIVWNKRNADIRTAVREIADRLPEILKLN